MLKDFKKFAVKGNVIDLAVGVVIGTAFGKIVSSLVSDIIMPPLGLLMGGVDFANKEFIDTINLSDNYLIAEFGETNEDTTKIKLRKTKSYDFYGHPNERLERNDETGYIEYVDYYYSSTGMEGGVDALVLLSPEFIQIQRPYPHYVRTFERLPFINRSYEETVLRLQHKIVKYTLEGVLF